MKVDGHCHCGEITFQAEVDPDALHICHCTDCQTLSKPTASMSATIGRVCCVGDRGLPVVFSRKKQALSGFQAPGRGEVALAIYRAGILHQATRPDAGLGHLLIGAQTGPAVRSRQSITIGFHPPCGQAMRKPKLGVGTRVRRSRRPRQCTGARRRAAPGLDRGNQVRSDSPLEGDGFEPSVPVAREPVLYEPSQDLAPLVLSWRKRSVSGSAQAAARMALRSGSLTTRVRPLSAWNIGWHRNTPTWRVLLPHGWCRTARRSSAPTL